MLEIDCSEVDVKIGLNGYRIYHLIITLINSFRPSTKYLCEGINFSVIYNPSQKHTKH